MSNLRAVVDELQSQNKTLTDVKDSIAAMVKADIDRRKEEERARGDELEKEREEKAEKARGRAKTSRSAPKSIAQGFAQGTGLDALKDLIPSFGGVLGGASLGGLMGLAAGKLFLPVLAGIFGGKLLDQWLGPTIDKVLGDAATVEIFGKEIDTSKLITGIAAAVGAIFAKDALVGAVRKTLGLGAEGADAAKTGAFRKMFLTRLGLGAAVFAIGDVLGQVIEDYTGNVTAGEITETLAEGLGLAFMFMPGGLLMKAMAGFAIAGGNLIRDYLRKRAEAAEAEFMKEVDDYATKMDLASKSDARLIELANQYANAEKLGKADFYNRDKGDGVPEAAFLKTLESRDPDQALVYQLREEIANQLEQVRLMAKNKQLAGDMLFPLQRALDEYKEVVGIPHSAAGELERIRKQMEGGANVKFYDDAILRIGRQTRSPVGSGRMSPGYDPRIQYLKDDPQAYANSILKGYTGQNINIGQLGDINNTNVSGGSKSSGGGQFGSAIDQYYIEKLMMQQGVRPGYGIYGF